MRKMRTLLILMLATTAIGSGRPRGTSTVRAIQIGPPRNPNPRFGDQKRAPLTSPLPAAPSPSPFRFGVGAGAAAAAQRDDLRTRSRMHRTQDLPSCTKYTQRSMGTSPSGSPEVPPFSTSLPVQSEDKKVNGTIAPLLMHAPLQLSAPSPKVVRSPMRMTADDALCTAFRYFWQVRGAAAWQSTLRNFLCAPGRPWRCRAARAADPAAADLPPSAVGAPAARLRYVPSKCVVFTAIVCV